MTEEMESSHHQSKGHRRRSQQSDRLVFVVPEDEFVAAGKAEVDLWQIGKGAWQYRWLITGIVLFFFLLALVYLGLAPRWYRAEVLLSPKAQQSPQAALAQFGGLASLAGIDIGDGDEQEAVAILGSKEFAREFIDEQGLLTLLLDSEWDADEGQWRGSDPKDWPDIRDAVKYFDENVRKVRKDPKTGLVTLSIEWKDPDIAANWAQLMVRRINQKTRERALTESEENIKYLRSELGETNVVTLQQSIARLLETELQKVMLARGNEEFSFRIIDPAVPPRLPARPNPVVIIGGALLCGLVISSFIAFAAARRRVQRSEY